MLGIAKSPLEARNERVIPGVLPFGIPAVGRGMHTIFAQYLERLNRLRRDNSTMVNFTRVAVEFTDFCESHGVNATEVEGWHIEEFLAVLPWANSTKRTALSNLRAAYRYAHQRGVIEKMPPTSYVKLPKEADSEPIVISCAELRAIKARCMDEQQWLLFHLYAYTGMRMSEGRLLDAEAVSLSDNTLRVMGKGGKLRLVPIHPALGEVLMQAGEGHILGNGKALTSQALYYRLHKIAPDRTFHDFRRTVASSLYANGVQTDTIDKILGWAPREVRSRYYQRIADRTLQEAILCLYADDPV